MSSNSKIEPWTLTVQIPSTVVHVIGILTTIFRLLYRWRLSKLWWEDIWATLALICDTACLASLWMQIAPNHPHTLPRIDIQSGWLLSLTITTVLWFARLSILCSIVRIANPTPKLRFIAYCISGLFVAMGAGLLAQKIFFCIKNFCWITSSVAIAQLVTDVISDAILVAVPIRFLRDVRLSRDRRILIISAFSATLLITGITIFHSLLLFKSATNTTMIIGHFRAALALFLCNALVLVTFVYRLRQKLAGDPEGFMAEGYGPQVGTGAVEFTTIIDLQVPSKLSSRAHPVTSEIQSKGDATHTVAHPLGTSAGSE